MTYPLDQLAWTFVSSQLCMLNGRLAAPGGESKKFQNPLGTGGSPDFGKGYPLKTTKNGRAPAHLAHQRALGTWELPRNTHWRAIIYGCSN